MLNKCTSALNANKVRTQDKWYGTTAALTTIVHSNATLLHCVGDWFYVNHVKAKKIYNDD